MLSSEIGTQEAYDCISREGSSSYPGPNIPKH